MGLVEFFSCGGGIFLVVVGFLYQWGGGILFSEIEGWNVEGEILFSEIEGWNFF